MNWSIRFAGRTATMKRSAVREFLKITAQPEMISFAGGLPAPDLFPTGAIEAALEKVMSRVGARALQYGETEGLAGLREWIAHRYSTAGCSLNRSNVMIVSGAQQALDLIGRVFLNPGDIALVENPTYLALLSAWKPNGVEFVALPGDDQGIDVDALDSVVGQPGKPKLLYVIPNFQNPSGITLAHTRRGALLNWARQNDAGIIEDDAYSELRYEGDALPGLLELDTRLGGGDVEHANVIRVGTFSKVLVPGLRVGWIIAPTGVVEKLVQAKQAIDLHTASLSQQLILELLENGELDRHLPRLREAYRARRDTMLAALSREFPAATGWTWTRPNGGMFLMVHLPRNHDATDLLRAALKLNLAFVPGEEFHLHGEGRHTFRLNFTNATPERIEVGIRRLAEANSTAIGRGAKGADV